uniref:Uncharacterized protein n=1 Tax=Octopus bimaculoides TaxID=37653 RepID=A0A0L8GUG7_OCTBM
MSPSLEMYNKQSWLMSDTTNCPFASLHISPMTSFLSFSFSLSRIFRFLI